ncbi:hypothetical protein QZJ86_08285 [Methylomonas montana]|uniref:hypothetical protein n=1 Tax=Methylomonas montana TaxID=3058963 RepID=UPI00265A41B7|nr:hypothetical protein [Methylomonas montana]WKJ92124.1 hypothetical protein QZJ86_08285 [Methylomonas montana]
MNNTCTINPALRARFACLCQLMASALLSHPASAEDLARQAEVARRGAEVTPISLARTQHQFLKTADGGVQRIVARDDMDLEQVWSIRRHLEELAQRFGRGDFSAPAFIHGADMPGLAQLRAAYQANYRSVIQPRREAPA